jgi:alpha-tubulin suppressor-like RCC1 family protein
MDSYLRNPDDKSPEKTPSDRRPLPPPRNKQLPPVPSQRPKLDIRKEESLSPMDLSDKSTAKSSDHIPSIKERMGHFQPHITTPLPVEKKKPPLPQRNNEVKQPPTPNPIITEEKLKSPRIGEDQKQKTPPPRPVSKIVLKGDLHEVNIIATTTPIPIKDVGTPLPGLKPDSLDDKRTLGKSATRTNVRESVRIAKGGFIPYVPPIEEEDGSHLIAEEKKPSKKKTVISPELKELYTKKYLRPSKFELHAVVVLQKFIRNRNAKKLYAKLKSIDYTRQKCVFELLETEQNYVADLKVLVGHYMKAFRENVKSEKPLISAADVQNVFADVEVILGFADHLVKQLQEELIHYDRFKTNIGDIIAGIAPFFKTYTRYCNNYEKATAILTKNKNANPEFKQFVLALDKDEKTNKLGLNSYLIKPIQRVPRYRLLLQDLIKNTHPEHPLYKKIDDALEKVKEVALHLNEAVRDIEERQKLTDIASQFEKTVKINLVESHRKPTKNGYVAFKDPHGNLVHLHLFTDCLVSSTGSVGAFQFKGKFDFGISVLYDYVVEDSKEIKFSIKTIDDELICVCPTMEIKNEWLKKIYTTAEQYKLERKENKITGVTLQDDTATTFSVAMSEEQIEISIAECVKIMKEGQSLLKYCRNTRPHFRRFALTEDENTLVWGSPNKNTTDSKVDLKHIKRILLGQKTAIFSRYPNPDIEEISFSILYENRTLDIACKDKREYHTWVKGLEYLLSREPRSTPEFPTEKSGVGKVNLLQSSQEESKKFKESFSQIGDAYVWGQGTRGALGNGKTQEDNLIPVIVKDFLYLDVDNLYVESGAGFALTTAGELFSWGANDSGRLGHGDENDRLLPTLCKPLQGHKVVQVAMGSTHTLCLEDNGSLWGFGGNKFGQLGCGNLDEKKIKPFVIPFWKDKKIKHIACGSWHSCVILEDGSVWTFGRGEDGQLGLGDLNVRESPTVLDTLHGQVAISSALGSWHSLVLLENGDLFSFGSQNYGQLGHNLISKEPLLVPARIEILKDKKVVSISAGSAHNAVIVDKGDIYTWGNGNYGQLGNGKKDSLAKPKLVIDLVGDNYKAKQVVCGVNHCLALMHSGKVFGWGAGTYGRLGIGTEEDKFSPQTIELFSDKLVRSIAAGGSNSGCVAAHQWVPDKDAKDCMACRSTFTFFNRRHHCRNCGGLYCGSCTAKKIILLRFGFDAPVRVCDNCYQILARK